jgi:Dicarboxylate carrier protein MatC N-terminus
MRKKIFLSILICLFAAGSVQAQGYGVGTPVEAKNMVVQAIAYLKANGEEKTLQEFDKPNGKFQWRDLYVFAYDPNGVMKGHPNPKLIGRNLYLFALAATNGTMEKVSSYAIRACGGKTTWLPLIIYILVSILTTIGPGNIAATALMAPVAMAIATRVGMPAFLMTLLVVGAANGAAFSPFAPTGIISNGIIAKIAPQLPAIQEAWTLDGLAWKIHFNSEYCQGIVNLGGFLLMGGWAWIMKQRVRQSTLTNWPRSPNPSPRSSGTPSSPSSS